MKEKPYVGITGFKTELDVAIASLFFKRCGFAIPGMPYKAMYGFPCSPHKIMNPDKQGSRGPSLNCLASLVKKVPGWALPMVHYFTNEKDTLDEQVKEVFSKNNLYDICKALQLNVAWPGLKQVRNIMDEYKEMKIVLQIPLPLVEETKIKDIVARAKEYDSLVSYVLVDPSRGKGKQFQEKDISLMCALGKAMPSTTMGIAGGLGPSSVKSKVASVKKEYNDLFSIDAEGALRKDNELSGYKVRDYIESSVCLIY